MDKMIRFTCPECGSHELIRVHQNATFQQRIEGVIITKSDSTFLRGDDGEMIEVPFDHSETDYRFKEVWLGWYLEEEGDIHFECGSCHCEMTDESGTPFMDDGDMTYWIVEHQEEISSKAESE